MDSLIGCIIAIDDCILFVKKKGEDNWMIPLGKQEGDSDAETAAQRIARDVAGVESDIVDSLKQYKFDKNDKYKYQDQTWQIVLLQRNKELKDYKESENYERKWLKLEDAYAETKDLVELNSVVKDLQEHPYFHTPTCDEQPSKCLIQ